MLTDSDVTIYAIKRIKGQLDPVYSCIYLPHVHCEEDLAVSVDKDGYSAADRIRVYAPTTKPLGVSKGDYLVRGEHPVITSPDELKTLKSSSRVYVITGVSDRLYGSKRLQHIEIAAV
ncbi:hypothetical protein GCWU000322_00082 [Eubacterium saphenum ATCC 49989]|nr:hypothetical protein GCWU000322_00082 [Eubacterium saphenum ATCC 49989]